MVKIKIKALRRESYGFIEQTIQILLAFLFTPNFVYTPAKVAYSNFVMNSFATA